MIDVHAALFHKDKRRIARNFARAAADYDGLARFQQTVGARLIESLPAMRVRPKVFLDLGSGTGTLARSLLALYPGSACIQIDLAEEMLRHARPRWPWRRRHSNWICADAEFLPVRDASLDLVASNLMLQWSNEPGRVLEEAMRVLRPGGLLLLSTLGPGTLEELRASWRDVDAGVHVNAFLDVHSLGTALVNMGFSGPVLETEKFTLTYADGLALMRDLKRLGTGNTNAGRVRTLTGKGRLNRMLQRYEEFRDGGRLPATYEVIYVHAWCPEGKVRHARGTITIPVSAIRRN
jgi:malonyl-CoA O-methyltransferase